MREFLTLRSDPAYPRAKYKSGGPERSPSRWGERDETFIAKEHLATREEKQEPGNRWDEIRRGGRWI